MSITLYLCLLLCNIRNLSSCTFVPAMLVGDLSQILLIDWVVPFHKNKDWVTYKNSMACATQKKIMHFTNSYNIAWFGGKGERS